MPIKTSLDLESVQKISQRLRTAAQIFSREYPGEPEERQPVHTVYGGAHLFRSDNAAKLGTEALKALKQYAPEPGILAKILGWPGSQSSGSFAYTLYDRIVAKLKQEPVEDFRIDFEDGYGNRADAEEDGHAVSAARELAQGLSQGALSPFIGIRIKPMSGELHKRSIRTLDIFLSELLDKSSGELPPRFVVTLPKVTRSEQVSALAELLGLIENKNGLAAGSLKLELMVETPQSILDCEGPALLRLVRAALGRCVAAHFGTYDYTALCHITAAHQNMSHPVCDFAKHMMQVSLAGTGIMLSDGATNIMPVPPHPAAQKPLTKQELEENRRAVHRAWKLHYEDIQHSLTCGYYQGWDLHPAQLVTRYASVYAFFLKSLPEASSRLKGFMGKAAQATLLGNVFDDAATGQGLLNFFLKGLNCGAITLEEARATGLSQEEFRSRSFVKILENRRRPKNPASRV